MPGQGITPEQPTIPEAPLTAPAATPEATPTASEPAPQPAPVSQPAATIGSFVDTSSDISPDSNTKKPRIKKPVLIGIIAGGGALIIALIITIIIVLSNSNPLIGKWKLEKYLVEGEDRTEAIRDSYSNIAITDDRNGTLTAGDKEAKIIYNDEYLIIFSTDDSNASALKYKYKDGQLSLMPIDPINSLIDSEIVFKKE
jgi:hypothetical protein